VHCLWTIEIVDGIHPVRITFLVGSKVALKRA
jgi:hypothetical protein